MLDYGNFFLDLGVNAFCYAVSEAVQAGGGIGQSNIRVPDQTEDVGSGRPDIEEHASSDDNSPVEGDVEGGDYKMFTGRKKKLWELRQKMVSFHLNYTSIIQFNR